ncbi:class I SAM-dependent methyltransferase [Roseomonas sp. GCM10028921]
MLDLLPVRPVPVADLGAGTGRDAAWFARQGHRVLAVEPVRALREAGEALHRGSGLAWLDDRLPGLAETRKRGPFDLITLCAVWQHLDEAAREAALASLAAITAPGGVVVMSLRHGPGAAGRPVFEGLPEATVAAASRAGFALLRRAGAKSLQAGNRAGGVRWIWLALERRC